MSPASLMRQNDCTITWILLYIISKFNLFSLSTAHFLI